MVDPSDTYPLTGFLRDHESHLDRLKSTGRPEVLTVDGQARIVVQDAAAYQHLLEIVEAVETERIIQERVASVQAGDPGIPVKDVLRDVRHALGMNE